jgi:1-acyl-sn-glycerol-3-phosphate acyltransferase
LSDLYYDIVYGIGTSIFWTCSRPLVLHRERGDRQGAFILAATHLTPFDVPMLIRHTPRRLDFVSIVEVFRNPFVAWFYGNMNAFPLDRSKPDGPTVRIILDRLQRGRAVAMFPEGGIRAMENSVLSGGRMRPGVGRLAQLANVPVVPAVVLGAASFSRVSAWMPHRGTRYGVIYGEPISLQPELDKVEATKVMEERLREAFLSLYRELKTAMEPNR